MFYKEQRVSETDKRKPGIAGYIDRKRVRTIEIGGGTVIIKKRTIVIEGGKADVTVRRVRADAC